jgi:hypothetical protein
MEYLLLVGIELSSLAQRATNIAEVNPGVAVRAAFILLDPSEQSIGPGRCRYA